MKPRIKVRDGSWICYDERYAGLHESMFKAYQWWWNCRLNNCQWQEIPF